MSDNAMTCCDGDSCATQESTPNLRTLRPAVDILERDNAWVLVADLPGVSNDAVDLTFERGELRLSAAQDADCSTHDFVLRERRPVRFVRAFRIGEGIDTNGISADFVDGVLTVTLPKAVELQPKKIAIS